MAEKVIVTKKRHAGRLLRMVAFWLSGLCFPLALSGFGIPSWSVSSGSYLYSMNAIIEVDISGQTPVHASDVLGIFVGNECRGVAHPVQFGSRRLYFMDIYSNVAQMDSMYFRFYDATLDFIYRSPKPLVFSRNTVQGSVASPKAASFALWNDYPITLFPVIDQVVLRGEPFDTLNMRDSLEQCDGDRIIWSVSAEPGFEPYIDEDTGELIVAPVSASWSGSGYVQVVATETGVVGHSDTVRIRYIVRPYTKVAFSPLLWQEIDTSDQFLPLDLGAYSTPADTCRRYYVQQLPVRGASTNPNWVAPTPGAGAMSVTAFVEYDGVELGSPTSQLAAFIGGQLRGVTTPTFALGRYWFFLDIANGAAGAIEFRYYDPVNKHIYEIPSGTNFVSSGSLGSLATPHVVSPNIPLQVTLSSAGVVQVAIQDSTWRGTQKVQVVAVDCGYGTDNRDTAIVAYRVWDDPSGFPTFESADSVTFVEGSCRALYQAEAYDFIDEFRLRYFVIGGADAASFHIAENTGALTWVTEPDYELPTDQNSDNLYEIQLEVRDLDDFRDTLSVRVYVLNKVVEGLSATIWNSGFLCGNVPRAELRASGGPTFTWSTGSQLSTIQVTQPGTYVLTVSDAETGCSETDTTVVERPALNLQPAQATVFDTAVVLGGAVPSGGVFSGSGVVQGKVYPTQTGGGKYPVQYDLQDSLGCMVSLSDTLFVYPFSGDLGSCGCQDVRVSLDSTGKYLLTTADVFTCEGALISVDDSNPLNYNLIDCPGTWSYIVLDASGSLKCRAKVTAVDITAPGIAEVRGRCNRPIVGTASNGLAGQPFQPVSPASFVWRDSFICPDISAILQNPLSWSDGVSSNPSYPYFAGGVRFVDETYQGGLCPCNTTVKVTDQVTFYPCSQVLIKKVWAKITRRHWGTDCHGNSQSVVQEIYLLRPDLPVNQLAQKEIYLNTQECGSASKQEMITAFKRKYYVFNNPYTCSPRTYGLFPESIKSAGGTADELLDYSYSLQAEIVASAPLCNGGLRLEVKILKSDACRVEIVPIDTVALYWVDAVAPIFEAAPRPAVLSANPLSGKAAFRADLEGLAVFFGLRITDNCGLSDFNLDILSCQDSLVQGIPVAGKNWRSTTYPTIQDGAQHFMTGLPPGRHLLHFTARDLCGNHSDYDLPLTVVDASAPVVKSRDSLSLALSATAAGYYGRVKTAEIDAGSADVSGLAWKRVRRAYNPLAEADFLLAGYDSDGDGHITTADGVDWNQDGFIGDNPNTPGVEVLERFEYSKEKPDLLMTPALDYTEWFCADLDGSFGVELWVMDKSTDLSSGCTTAAFATHPALSGGNLNYSHTVVRVYDLLPPEFAVPPNSTILCTERSLVDALSEKRVLPLQSSTYQSLEQALFLDKKLPGFEVVTGAGCRTSQIEVAVSPDLHCEAGVVTMTYYEKKPGLAAARNLGQTQVTIRPIHAYTLRFPADIQVDCHATADTANVADGAELGCDALAVFVSDKRYNSLATDRCYTIFRTFTVVNWCQYNEACGDPASWAVVVPKDPGANGSNGVNLLLRDSDEDGIAEIYYEDQQGTQLVAGVAYNAGQGIVSSDDLIPNLSSFPTCAQAGGERFAWTYTQEIAVRDETAPVVDEAPERVFPLSENTCAATVSLTVTARDSCFGQPVTDTSASLQLEYARLSQAGGEAVAVTLEADPANPHQWHLRGTYPEGAYTLAVRVRDGCGNVSREGIHLFRVADTGVSAPVCKNGLSLTLTKTSPDAIPDARIWATDVKGSDIFDCNGQVRDEAGRRIISPEAYFLVKDANADGKFGFADGLDEQGIPVHPAVSTTFDCRDMQGDSARLVRIRLYARDELGNWSWCDTYIHLLDADRACAAVNLSMAELSGTIQTLSGEKLEGVELSLQGALNLAGETDSTGHFRFFGLYQGAPYTVTPFLDKQAQNGVSTIDLIQITQHILGRKVLDSPYRLLAADVNNSGSITTMDIIQMRRLVLNLTERFPGNPSWRFIDAAYSFQHPEAPWKDSFPEWVRIDSLLPSSDQLRFVAVKTGDVNGNARGSLRSQPPVNRPGAAYVLHTEQQHLEAGSSYTIDIQGDLRTVEGFQFTLEADPAMVRIESAVPLALSEQHIGVFPTDGFLTCSWDAVGSPEESAGAAERLPLLRLTLHALKAGMLSDALKLNSRLTPAESYIDNAVSGGVQLEFVPSADPVFPALYLAQNQPNPFRGETTIAFSLPQAGEAVFTVRDVLGRLVFSRQGSYPAGRQELVLRSRSLGGAGIYFYSLEQGGQQVTHRLILAE